MTPSARAGRLRAAIASKLRALARARDEARRWSELAAEVRARVAAGRGWWGSGDTIAKADAGALRCRAKAERLDGEVKALRAEVRALERAPCGARCRDGHACRAPRVPGARRCKLHGGRSTGARTPEGKARALEALARARLLRALAREAAEVPAEGAAG